MNKQNINVVNKDETKEKKKKTKKELAKKFFPETTPGSDHFTMVFFQTYKKEVIPTLFNCSMKKEMWQSFLILDEYNLYWKLRTHTLPKINITISTWK